MIRVGDKLMFSTKAMNDIYGHGEPVEVLSVNDNGIMSAYYEGLITVRVWEPFLYYGQEPFQHEMTFHKSHFLPAGCAIPGPTWFERLLDKVFA